MRDLISTRGGLHTLRWETRFVYTIWLVLTFAGYVAMVALGLATSGIDAESIVRHYRGDEAEMVYGMSHRELLELSHFHLFAMPLFLFVQGHLFLLTRWPRPLKAALVVAAALGIAFDLAVPWLVIHLSPDWAPLKNVGRVLMAVPFAAFAVVPLWEMWGPLPASDPPREPPPARVRS